MRQFALIAIAGILVAAPVMGACSAAEKKALQDFDHAWGEAARVGNRAALQQTFADDYMNLNPGGAASKGQAIDNAVRAAEETRRNPNPPAQPIYDHYSITCTPTTAVIIHKNTTGSAERPSYSRSIHVLEKRGGRWQVIADSGHPLSDATLLTYLEKDWTDAMMRKDTAWLERNLASDFSSVHPVTGALQTKAQDIAEITAMTFNSMEMSDLTTRVEGDTAVVTGVGTARGVDKDGKPFAGKVRFTDVFVKRDGRWQALSAHATMIPD